MTGRPSRTGIYLSQWNSGSDEGLKGLIDYHLPWVRRHVRTRLGVFLRLKEETEDYVQDVVVQFLKYGPRLKVTDDDHFRRLLIRIVENLLRDKNKWYSARRRQAASERPLPSDTVLSLDPPRNNPIDTPSRCADRNEQEAWVRLGMEFLAFEDREVIVLRQWDSLPFKQIARRLGITPDAARMRHNRAMMRLSDQVQELRDGKKHKTA